MNTKLVSFTNDAENLIVSTVTPGIPSDGRIGVTFLDRKGFIRNANISRNVLKCPVNGDEHGRGKEADE